MPNFNKEKSFEAIVQTAIDGIIVIDEFNKIRSFNPGAENLLGWTAEEAIGQDVSIIIPEKYREAHYKGIKRFLETKIPKVLGTPFVHLPSLHKDGHEIATNISIATWTENDETFFTGIIRDVTETKEYEEQQNILIRELNHRVKNTLAVISSIISQTANLSNNVEDFQVCIQERIMAMSSTHDLLVDNNWEHATIQQLVDKILNPFGKRFTYAGPYVDLKPNIAVTMGMAFHELATNSIKYGSWSENRGYVIIYGDIIDGKMELTWKERGGPMLTPCSKKGFGTILLTRVVSSAIRGEAKIECEPDGLRYIVKAPLSKDIRALN